MTAAVVPGFNVYGHLATAYETAELERSPGGRDGCNPELDPSRLRSFELGVRGLVEPARLRYEVAAYRSRAWTGQCRSIPAVSGSTTTTPARPRDSVELSRGCRPTARFEVRLAYTRQDFVFRRFVLDGVDYARGKREPGRVGDIDVQPFAGIGQPARDERYRSSGLANELTGRYYRPSPGREIYVGLTFGGGSRSSHPASLRPAPGGLAPTWRPS